MLEIKIINGISLLQKKNIKIKDFSICGGVAANKYLNTELQKLISTKKLNFHQVPLSLCTDNAAMIAIVGYLKYIKGEALPENTSATARLKVEEA